MNRHLMTLMMGASALMLAASHVQAQGRNCAPHAAVAGHLAQKYGESRQMMGLAANNMVLEVYVAPDSGTWTVTVTRPDGVTCLMASGTDADTTPLALPNTDPDA